MTNPPETQGQLEITLAGGAGAAGVLLPGQELRHMVEEGNILVIFILICQCGVETLTDPTRESLVVHDSPVIILHDRMRKTEPCVLNISITVVMLLTAGVQAVLGWLPIVPQPAPVLVLGQGTKFQQGAVGLHHHHGVHLDQVP